MAKFKDAVELLCVDRYIGSQNYVWFVTSAKDNMVYKVIESGDVDTQTGLIFDETIQLTGFVLPGSILAILDSLCMKILGMVRTITFSQTISRLTQ